MRRVTTPNDYREKPALAVFALLRAGLEISRGTVLATLDDDEHQPHACNVCMARVVLLHIDALLDALHNLILVEQDELSPPF